MDESKIYDVSVRGWITFLLVLTVCIMAILMKKVEEPLYSLASMAVGFYLGSKAKNGDSTTPVADSTKN
jgi:hypothetical protein